jgi:hypothetical protein
MAKRIDEATVAAQAAAVGLIFDDEQAAQLLPLVILQLTAAEQLSHWVDPGTEPACLVTPKEGGQCG